MYGKTYSSLVQQFNALIVNCQLSPYKYHLTSQQHHVGLLVVQNGNRILQRGYKDHFDAMLILSQSRVNFEEHFYFLQQTFDGTCIALNFSKYPHNEFKEQIKMLLRRLKFQAHSWKLCRVFGKKSCYHTMIYLTGFCALRVTSIKVHVKRGALVG